MQSAEASEQCKQYVGEFHILASMHDTNTLCTFNKYVAIYEYMSNTSNTSALPYSHQHASCICRRRTITLCNLNKSILQFRQIRFKIGSQQYKQNVGCFIFSPACILHDTIYRRRTTTKIKQTRSGKKTQFVI